MILINFSHPLTGEQQAAIEVISGQKISRLVEQMAQFDLSRPFAGQAVEMVDQVGLTPAEWQQGPLLVLLPSLNFGAAAVLAELHGRCGHFPPLIRLRPVEGSLSPKYEAAEIVNLQAIRDQARERRG